MEEVSKNKQGTQLSDPNLDDKQAKLSEQEIKLEGKEKHQKHQASLLTAREQALNKRESELNKQDKELAQEKGELDNQQRKIELGLPEQAKAHYAQRKQELDKYAKQLDEHNKQQHKKSEEFQKLKISLNSLQEKLEIKQQEADAGFAGHRSELEKELAEEKTKRLAQLNQDLAEEEKKLRAKIDSSLEKIRADLDSGKEKLIEGQAELNDNLEQLRLQQATLKNEQANLTLEVERQVEARKLSFERTEAGLKKENQRLIGSLERSDNAVSLHEELKKQLGGKEPAAVLERLTSQQEELVRLNEELLNRPSKEIQERYDAMDSRVKELEYLNQQLVRENRDYQQQQGNVDSLDFDIGKLKRENEGLKATRDAEIRRFNEIKKELERLSPAYEAKETREKRIQGITREVITNRLQRLEGNINELSVLEVNEARVFTELEWLESIRKNTENYGLSFSKRILFAFHTALKIAEWSPITVLAGVSGTGKSELPRLYAHFGGINFMNVPVQPNWDSQESLLGYYNSIDNCFEAQPILNFLAQSQEKSLSKSDINIYHSILNELAETKKELKNDKENSSLKDKVEKLKKNLITETTKYNGLNDTVNLVLLDEMNLAHVELYFADFLSKLEQRRGIVDGQHLPDIKVKLGANIGPYSLALGRNIRFVGTMNQDETTKSLSDKVLDRGISIYFPRPTILKERKKLIPLGVPLGLLPRKLWNRWTKLNSDLPDQETEKYKGIIEEINNYLGSVGKALGHRVWQSIEYYMVNHPLVKALSADPDCNDYKKALHFAFEDQLVQKVMPKLRGIETRGIGKTKCLGLIEVLLTNEKLNLVEDFSRACRSGYGQFMWCSADYLNDEQANKEYEQLWEQAYKTYNTKKVENKDKETQSSTRMVGPMTEEQFKKLKNFANEHKIQLDQITKKEMKNLGILPKDISAIEKHFIDEAKKEKESGNTSS